MVNSLLPAIAFLIIGLGVKNCYKTAATVAISCSTTSFILALGVAMAVFNNNITVDSHHLDSNDLGYFILLSFDLPNRLASDGFGLSDKI